MSGATENRTQPDAPSEGMGTGPGFLPEIREPQDWARLGLYLAGRGMALDAEPPPRQFAGGFGNLFVQR